IAVFGGALGQSKIGAAACEGAARNPGAAGRIQTMMILGLALIESLVLFALVIVFVKVLRLETIRIVPKAGRAFATARFFYARLRINAWVLSLLRFCASDRLRYASPRTNK